MLSTISFISSSIKEGFSSRVSIFLTPLFLIMSPAGAFASTQFQCSDLFNPLYHSQRDLFLQSPAPPLKSSQPRGRLKPGIREENFQSKNSPDFSFKDQLTRLPGYLRLKESELNPLNILQLKPKSVYLHSRYGTILLTQVNPQSGTVSFKKINLAEANGAIYRGSDYIQFIMDRTNNNHSDILRSTDIIIENHHQKRTEFLLSMAMRERSLARSALVFAAQGFRSIKNSNGTLPKELKVKLKSIHDQVNIPGALEATFNPSERSRKDPTFRLSSQETQALFQFITLTFEKTGLDLIQLGIINSSSAKMRWPRYSDNRPISFHNVDLFRSFLMQNSIKTAEAYSGQREQNQRSSHWLSLSAREILYPDGVYRRLKELNEALIESLKDQRPLDLSGERILEEIVNRLVDSVDPKNLPELIVGAPLARSTPLLGVLLAKLADRLGVPYSNSSNISENYLLRPITSRQDHIQEHLSLDIINQGLSRHPIMGKKIMVLDFLTQSGSRLSYSAQLLIQLGAGEVKPYSIIQRRPE